MARHIVYSAILEDALTLAARAGNTQELCKRTMDKYKDCAHIGNICDISDEYADRLLRDIVSCGKRRREEDLLWEKSAFYLGYLCRKAADKEFGVLGALSEEAEIEQDASIFREYYTTSSGYESGISVEELKKLGLSTGEAIGEMELLLRALVKRAIIRMHTFKPGYEDIHTWLERFYELHAAFGDRIHAYAEAIVAPGAGNIKKYITGPRFYCGSDLISSAVKKLRAGIGLNAEEISAALASEPDGIYGRALKSAVEAVMTQSGLPSGSCA